MSFLFVLLFGIVAWRRPVLGYALFMFLQTPLSNVVAPFANPRLGPVVLILATIKLLVRKPQPLRLRGIEICALALSVVVLFRHAELMSLGFSPGVYVQLLFFAFLWGPLLVAFNRLDEEEMASLRLWMSVAGIVVGVWGTLIYLTGSDYLMRTAIWGDPGTEEATRSLASSVVELIVKGRFVVMGLFTVAPSAYWYILRGAFAQTRQHWLWNLAMWSGVGTMLVAVGISVTRSMFLLLGMGTVVMLAAWVLTGGMSLRSRARALAIAALGACLLGVAVKQVDFTPVIEQYQARFSTLGWDDRNVVSRVGASANAWAYIGQNLCFFGAPGPNPMSNFESGDTALVPYLWLYYGVPGVVLFSALYFTAFWRLFKCWLARGLSPEQQLLRSMLTAWSVYFVYVWIVGYGLHPPEVFFTMLFVSEVGRLHGKWLTTPNSEPRRTAA